MEIWWSSLLGNSPYEDLSLHALAEMDVLKLKLLTKHILKSEVSFGANFIFFFIKKKMKSRSSIWHVRETPKAHLLCRFRRRTRWWHRKLCSSTLSPSNLQKTIKNQDFPSKTRQIRTNLQPFFNEKTCFGRTTKRANAGNHICDR